MILKSGDNGERRTALETATQGIIALASVCWRYGYPIVRNPHPTGRVRVQRALAMDFKVRLRLYLTERTMVTWPATVYLS